MAEGTPSDPREVTGDMVRSVTRAPALCSRPAWLAALWLLALLASLQASCTAAQADEPQPLWEVGLDDLPDLHDGSLDDWRRLLATPTFTQADMVFLQAAPGHEPLGSAALPDLAVEGYLAWNSSTGRIYCGIEVTDDVYIPHDQWAASSWTFVRADQAWIVVDGDASGGQFVYSESVYNCDHSYEEAWETGAVNCYPDLFLTQRQAQYYSWIGTGLSGGVLTMFEHRTWVFAHDLVEAGGRVYAGGTPTRYTLEASITPFDNLDWRGLEHSVASDLAPGGTIGILVGIMDADSDDGWPDHFATYLQPVNDRGSSDDLPRFRLIGLDQSPTVVRPASWAEVKGTAVRVEAQGASDLP